MITISSTLWMQFSQWLLILKTNFWVWPAVYGNQDTQRLHLFSMLTTIYNMIMSVSPNTIIQLVTYHLGNKNNKPSCNFKHFKIIHPENTKEVFKNNYDMFSLHIYSFLFSSSPLGYLGLCLDFDHTCFVNWLVHATVRYWW